MLGLVNIVKIGGETAGKAATSKGGGIVLAVALLIGGVYLYRGADAGLRGIAESSAAANRVAAWAFAAVLVVGVVTAAVWVLLGRRRDVQQAPEVAAFQARTDRALAARRRTELGTGHRAAIGGDRAVGAVDSATSGRQAPLRVAAAQRLDRLPGGEPR